MQYTLGGMLHLSGLHNSTEGIACTVNITAGRQTGSNHYCYEENKKNQQQKPKHNSQNSCSAGAVFQAKFLQSDPCLPPG